VVIDPGSPVTAPVTRDPQRRKRSRRSGEDGIELEVDGVVVRVGRGAEGKKPWRQ